MPDSTFGSPAIEVFYSYSHHDEVLRDELEKHLSILRRQGVISQWHDRQIGAGREWEGQIDQRLNSAQVILILISADFLASDYCYDIEMMRAMERHDSGEARVIPVILRSVDWRGAPFGKLQALPKDAKPVTGDAWPTLDDAFTDVARGIRSAISDLAANPPEPPAGSGATPTGSPRVPAAPIWNVPHHRNPNFTGREELLDGLRAALTSEGTAALTQPQAIHGLGGVGKTQLATEYVYRYAGEYDLVWWVPSEEPSALAATYAALARTLDLPEQDAAEQSVTIEAVKRWLDRNGNWLLVLDNAAGPDEVRSYLPQAATGHILITSRDPNWGGVARLLPVETFPRGQSVEFLLKRTGQSDEEAADSLAEAMGDLPLALEQAGAYIEESGTTLVNYLELFQERSGELLSRGQQPGYQATVATTWEISLQQLSQSAADLMSLFTFLETRTETPILPKSSFS